MSNGCDAFTINEVKNKLNHATLEIQAWLGTPSADKTAYAVQDAWEVLFLKTARVTDFGDLHGIEVYRSATVGDVLAYRGRECRILRVTPGLNNSIQEIGLVNALPQVITTHVVNQY